jgi:hypothetical protein
MYSEWEKTASAFLSDLKQFPALKRSVQPSRREGSLFGGGGSVTGDARVRVRAGVRSD